MVNFDSPVVTAKERGASALYSLFSKSGGKQRKLGLTYLLEESKWFWSLVDGIFMWAHLLVSLAFCSSDVSYN